MKLFDYETYEDYGKEWMFQVLKFPKFALLDITVQWDDYGDDKIIPEISLTISTRNLFGFFIRYKRFQFDFELMTLLPRNLDWYRKNK
jgi:hypothetical protein